MGSTRLPGKVLLPLGPATVLEHVITRVKATPGLAEVVIATTRNPQDDRLAAAAAGYGATVFRGSEEDVLERYYQAAEASGADVVVRITSDCPLIDPEVVGQAVARFATDGALDYLSNAVERTYPRGLDTEVFSFAALARAHREATRAYEREHVTPYLNQHPERFRLAAFHNPAGNFAHLRWTLDTPEDYQFFQAVFHELAHLPTIRTADVLALLERRPDIGAINAAVEQKKLGG
jgi:spore coat polysaccharide biosynthesis protein SpsF